MLKIRRPGGDESLSPLETRLELHLFEYSNNLVGKTGTVYFHKRMRDSSIFSNGFDLLSELRETREETEELIY
jgi:FAD synthase